MSNALAVNVVDDLWVAENIVRGLGLDVAGTNLEARHFFIHPRDTFGILVEWTDHGVESPPSKRTPVELAWITAVVRDTEIVARFFQELCGATRVTGLPAGEPADEATVDLAIGDVVLRLVSPRSDASRFAAFLDGVGERLHSFALRVDDLDFPVRAGLPVVENDGVRAWTDPTATLGLRVEWVAS